MKIFIFYHTADVRISHGLCNFLTCDFSLIIIENFASFDNFHTRGDVTSVTFSLKSRIAKSGRVFLEFDQ